MLTVFVPEKKGFFKIAAEEFVSFYAKMTGVKLKIVTSDDGKSDMVVIGSDAVNAFTLSKIIDKTISPFSLVTGTDGYQILSASDQKRKFLFLAGGRNRAVLYALYHFFEIQGCRYFWDGDIVPEKKSISIEGLDIRETPRFEYRGLRYFAHRSLKRFQAEHWDVDDWRKELDWCLKKRFNIFMLRIGMDDVFQKAFPDTVTYPKWHVPESVDRSYDDRDLFWSLQYRGEIRKTILAYARERDMMHPEDLGTMTHWYSRTPNQFLEKFKPDFMPQATGGYGEPTGLVWDIRQDKNLDNYFKLTQAHIDNYGSPEIFHTIGLAERRCYADHASNHEMKLYTYRRIIQKLRSKYPNAPLLIGSWDFCMYWTPEEVKSLLAELDREKTIILEYTSETDNELNNFNNWGMVGKFPWIFGIFHAFEPNTDLRGYYDITERRLAIAAGDPMCKGMVFWPESSHTDTLVLEYLGANSWSPEDSNRKLDSFIEKFASDRYGALCKELLPIWKKFIPVMKMRGFVGPQQKHSFIMISEVQFKPLDCLIWDVLGTPSANAVKYEDDFVTTFHDELLSIPGILREIAKLDLANSDPFVKRDMIDIARSSAIRVIMYGYFKFTVMYAEWCRGKDWKNDLLALLDIVDRCYGLFGAILESHEDYSMNASLKELQTKHECNPDFEHTLKGNAENGYCRAHIFELVENVYRKEFRIFDGIMRGRILADDRSFLTDLEALVTPKKKAVSDAFYATPLAKMAPKTAKALKNLPSTLRALADETEAIGSEKVSESIVAFAKAAKL